jgi:hypothetical protein
VSLVFGLASLGCFLWLFANLLWNAEKLVGLGLTDSLFYVALVLLGLFAAVALFLGLDSYAEYQGSILGGSLKLGGPAVIFVLVVIGGFRLPKPSMPFSITVFVNGEGGLADVPLRNLGYVVLDIGADRRRQQIGDKGDAHIEGIPQNFRGQEVNMWVDSDTFESVQPNARYRLSSSSVYMTVRKKNGKISGRIQDQTGKPIKNANVSVRGLATLTNESGWFELEINGAGAAENLEVVVEAVGFAEDREKVLVNSNPVTVVLTRLKTGKR